MTAYLDKLRNTIAELRVELDKALEFAERMRTEREALRDAHDQIATNYNTVSFTAEKRMEEIERLRAQLAEAYALLREIHEGEISGFARYSKIEALLSANAEPSAPEVNHDPK